MNLGNLASDMNFANVDVYTTAVTPRAITEWSSIFDD